MDDEITIRGLILKLFQEKIGPLEFTDYYFLNPPILMTLINGISKHQIGIAISDSRISSPTGPWWRGPDCAIGCDPIGSDKIFDAAKPGTDLEAIVDSVIDHIRLLDKDN